MAPPSLNTEVFLSRPRVLLPQQPPTRPVSFLLFCFFHFSFVRSGFIPSPFPSARKSVRNLLTSSRSLLSGKHLGKRGTRGSEASRAVVVRGDNVTSLFFAERN